MENKTIQKIKGAQQTQTTELIDGEFCPDFTACSRSQHFKCDTCGGFLHKEQVFIVKDLSSKVLAKYPYHVCNLHAAELQDYFIERGLLTNIQYSIRRMH